MGEKLVGRKGVRFFKSKRKDKEIEKERKKKGGRKEQMYISDLHGRRANGLSL